MSCLLATKTMTPHPRQFDSAADYHDALDAQERRRQARLEQAIADLDDLPSGDDYAAEREHMSRITRETRK
jgi:hypothetical protein